MSWRLTCQYLYFEEKKSGVCYVETKSKCPKCAVSFLLAHCGFFCFCALAFMAAGPAFDMCGLGA